MQTIDLTTIPVAPTDFGRWAALNGPLGLDAFGVNVVEPGIDSSADIEHDETDSLQQELYVVLCGRARFTVGGEVVEAGAGTALAVPDPALTRSYEALEVGTRVLCIGAPPSGSTAGWGDWIGDGGT
jgi:mannose-6-phosphate isomerase-like protein (cupin superfamily)